MSGCGHDGRGRARDGCVAAADGRRSPCVHAMCAIDGVWRRPANAARSSSRRRAASARPSAGMCVMGASENEEYGARLRTRSERAGSQPPSRPANARARTLRYARYKFGGKTVVPTERGLPPRTCSNCIHTELPVVRSVVLVSGSQSPFCFIACESCVSGVCVRVSAVSDDAPAPRLRLFRSQRRAANVSARVLSTVFFFKIILFRQFFLPPLLHHQDIIFSSIALFFGSRRISFKRLYIFFHLPTCCNF